MRDIDTWRNKGVSRFFIVERDRLQATRLATRYTQWDIYEIDAKKPSPSNKGKEPRPPVRLIFPKDASFEERAEAMYAKMAELKQERKRQNTH